MLFYFGVVYSILCNNPLAIFPFEHDKPRQLFKLRNLFRTYIIHIGCTYVTTGILVGDINL